MATKQFKVVDMTCSSCVMHLEGIEDKLPGIDKIEANYKNQTMVATFDESKVGEDQLIAAVKKEGYTAVPSEVEPKESRWQWKR